MFSAIISNAPCIASSTVFTALSLFCLSFSSSLSIFIYCLAISSIGVLSFCSNIIFDKENVVNKNDIPI